MRRECDFPRFLAGLHLLAGADVTFSRDGSEVIAGVVVWDLADQTVVEQRAARVASRFPYVPGLLSFRELHKKKTEPIELCVVEVPAEYVGPVMEHMGNRRGICTQMEVRPDLTHLEFTIPARGLIGMRNRLLTATSGTVVMHHNFYQYEFLCGAIPGRAVGVLIASEPGQVTAYALDQLKDRGDFFVEPTEPVYEGQIVGEHCHGNDIAVNICRGKRLTNMRAASADKTVVLKPPRRLTLEIALEFIEDDELVEVTPAALRLRKRHLKEIDRKRAARKV